MDARGARRGCVTDAGFAARLTAMRAMLISSALAAAFALSAAAGAAPTSLLPVAPEAPAPAAALAPLAEDSVWTPRFEAAAGELAAALRSGDETASRHPRLGRGRIDERRRARGDRGGAGGRGAGLLVGGRDRRVARDGARGRQSPGAALCLCADFLQRPRRRADMACVYRAGRARLTNLQPESATSRP